MKQEQKQKGIAMILVICIMAILVMMSLALMLAASVMVSNAGRTKQQTQARILAVSMADELEKDLTLTQIQADAIPQSQRDGSIRGYVNQQILSGSWESWTEGSNAAQAERCFLLDSGIPEEAGLSEGVCSVTLYWQQGQKPDDGDISLTVKVTCSLQQASFTVTTVYTADDETGEGGSLCWIRSERR